MTEGDLQQFNGNRFGRAIIGRLESGWVGVVDHICGFYVPDSELTK